MNKTFRNYTYFIFFFVLTVAFTSCGTMNYLYRNQRLNQRMALLELGMSKREVLETLQYQPDFFTKEASRDGLREILMYKAYIERPYERSIPVVYQLIFLDSRLVVAETLEDHNEQDYRERMRIENARRAAEERRLKAILEAQEKDKKENE